MAKLPVLIGIGQKCSSCRQRSNPKTGNSNWEEMGIWNGLINKCTKCGSLMRVGFLFDEPLTKEDSEGFLSFREEFLRNKKLVFHKKGALSFLIDYLFRSPRS